MIIILHHNFGFKITQKWILSTRLMRTGLSFLINQANLMKKIFGFPGTGFRQSTFLNTTLKCIESFNEFLGNTESL